MNLQDIFDQLTYGELAQVKLGGTDEAGITSENRKRFITHVNLALTELHKRFLIKEGRLTVVPVDGVLNYVLESRYAQTNPDLLQPLKYINDVGTPFKDDLFKIERVYDQDNNELILNNKNDATSLYTSNYKTLVLPLDHTYTSLKIIYRANHPKLTDIQAMYPPNMVEILMPDVYMEPLVYYIASRVMNPIGVSQEFHEGNNYMAKYEQACQRLENLNFQIDNDSDNERFARGGWV